jgi:deoxyadenosine/deoxycytidine kinase
MNVSIDGNIGSGKTTIVRLLRAHQKRTVTDDNEHTAGGFSNFVGNMLHFGEYTPATPGTLIVWENNPYCIFKVFGHLFGKSVLVPVQYSLYKAVVQRVLWKPTLLFYLEVDVNTLILRSKNLKTRDILEKIDKQYKYILRHVQDVDVVYLDGTLPPEQNVKLIMERLKLIKCTPPLNASSVDDTRRTFDT